MPSKKLKIDEKKQEIKELLNKFTLRDKARSEDNAKFIKVKELVSNRGNYEEHTLLKQFFETVTSFETAMFDMISDKALEVTLDQLESCKALLKCFHGIWEGVEKATEDGEWIPSNAEIAKITEEKGFLKILDTTNKPVKPIRIILAGFAGAFIGAIVGAAIGFALTFWTAAGSIAGTIGFSALGAKVGTACAIAIVGGGFSIAGGGLSGLISYIFTKKNNEQHRAQAEFLNKKFPPVGRFFIEVNEFNETLKKAPPSNPAAPQTPGTPPQQPSVT